MGVPTALYGVPITVVLMSSAPLPFPDYGISSPPVRRRRAFSSWSVSRVSAAPRRWKAGAHSPDYLIGPRLCFKNDGNEATNAGDAQARSAEPTGPQRDIGDQSVKAFSSNKLMQRLKKYGVAGVLSYGLLNTVYYLTTFLLVWFYFAPAPGKMGYAAAVQRFLKLIAVVWAGSQVTKILRAGGALALAPFVDRGLSWFTVKFEFESEGKAFAAIVCLCFGLALLLFFGLTLLWA